MTILFYVGIVWDKERDSAVQCDAGWRARPSRGCPGYPRTEDGGEGWWS